MGRGHLLLTGIVSSTFGFSLYSSFPKFCIAFKLHILSTLLPCQLVLSLCGLWAFLAWLVQIFFWFGRWWWWWDKIDGFLFIVRGMFLGSGLWGVLLISSSFAFLSSRRFGNTEKHVDCFCYSLCDSFTVLYKIPHVIIQCLACPHVFFLSVFAHEMLSYVVFCLSDLLYLYL
jgi:hypothetical protein